MARPEQRIEDQLQGFPVLEGLSIGEHDSRYRIGGKGFLQAFEIERSNRLIGDDRHLATTNMWFEVARIIQQPFADIDRIAAVTKIDVERAHETPRQERWLA
ncbi:hypothetical protein D3C76_652650 [compost metagenome]